MNVEQLQTILQHLPPELPVHISGKGEVMEVRRYNPADNPWVTHAVYLDVGEVLCLRGRFRDRRTLDVRLGLVS